MGVLSEQLVFTQLLHSSWAMDKDIELYSFRVRSGEEVDFIVKLEQEIFAIEVKNSEMTTTDDILNLELFRNLYPDARGLYLFHMGTKERKMGKVWSLPWAKGLKEMGL